MKLRRNAIAIITGGIFLSVIGVSCYILSVHDAQVSDSSGRIQTANLKTPLGQPREIAQTDRSSPQVKNLEYERANDESAAERLSKFLAGNSNIDERCLFVQELIAELCSQGKNQEAYDLIDPFAGHLRASGMFGFYAAASIERNELIRMMKGEDFHDLHPALHGYMKGLTFQQVQAEIESSRLANLQRDRESDMPPGLVETTITSALESSMAGMARSDALIAMDFCRELAEKGTIKTYQIYELVQKNANLEPFERWEYLKQVEVNDSAGVGTSAEVKMREKLIDTMIREDGGKALSSILANNISAQSADVEMAVRTWTKLEPAGIAGWYKQMQNSLSNDERSMIASSLSTVASEYGEFENARQWVGEIRDPAKRAEALSALEVKAANYQAWLEEGK